MEQLPELSIYKRVRQNIINNKRAREQGKVLCLPWTNFPKLSTVLPGIQKGRYYIVTSGPKAGKTQITDNLFVLEPIDYLINNPNSNMKVKIVYFTLEMSKEDKINQLISNKIYKDTGLIIGPDNLNSLFGDFILDDDIASYLFSDEYERWFEYLENTVTFIDHITNPTGIWSYMREVARQNGTFYFKGQRLNIPENADWKHIRYDLYVPNDPDLVIEVICDHVSLLSEEEGAPTLGDAINRYSGTYCRKMRNNFGFTPINVHQQALATEAQQYHNGRAIVNKVKPTHTGLGDAKLASRDCDIMLGLFNPSRFDIEMYPERNGYDIAGRFGDHYRELSILLNRRGGGNIELDLYFHGAVNVFKELPPPTEFRFTPELYTQYNL